MLTRREYNDLYRLLEVYTMAWELYVKDVAENAPGRHGSGAMVANAKEDLLRYLRKELV